MIDLISCIDKSRSYLYQPPKTPKKKAKKKVKKKKKVVNDVVVAKELEANLQGIL